MSSPETVTAGSRGHLRAGADVLDGSSGNAPSSPDAQTSSPETKRQPAYPPARRRGVMARSVADPGVEPAAFTSGARGQQTPGSPAPAENPPAAAASRAEQDRASAVRPAPDGLPGPRQPFVAKDDRSAVPAPFSIPLPFEEHPIDLATALRLADAANPTIGAARTVVLEALANQLAARVLLVPSLNSGVSYHGHQGFLQRSSGKIISLSQQSLYVGSGVMPVTAGNRRAPRREYPHTAHRCMVRADGRNPARDWLTIPCTGDGQRSPARCRKSVHRAAGQPVDP